METPNKLDMTKEEIQYYVELMLSLAPGSLAKVTQPVLISMHNGLTANAMAFNHLEDKYRELMQKGNYKPLAKHHTRKKRKPDNAAIREAFRKGGIDV